MTFAVVASKLLADAHPAPCVADINAEQHQHTTMASSSSLHSPPLQAAQRPERLLPADFWVYSFKVQLCPIQHFHDWEKCVFAHEGEKARRRHPSQYQAVQCPEARAKKICPRGDDCPCTHHLFEYWLHPDRYMTCMCELGPTCNRPICFFAHHASELRPMPGQGARGAAGLSHGSPTSTSSSRSHRAAAAAAAETAARAASPSSGLSSSVAGVSRSSSPGVSLGVAGGRTGEQLGAGVARQLSSSSLTSSRPAGSGTFPAPVQLAGQHDAGSGSSGSNSTASTARPGFAALSALGTPHAQAASGGAAAAAVAATSQAAPGGAEPGRRAVVLQSPPPLDGSQQQQLLAPRLDSQHPLLQQATQQLQQMWLAGDSAAWGMSTSSPATTMAPSGSALSLASSNSAPLSPTGSTLLAAMQQQQQQSDAAAAASAAAAVSGGFSPCHSLGGASSTSLPALNALNFSALAGPEACGFMGTTVDAHMPVSTPGSSQHGQLPGSGFALMNAPNAMQLAALQAALESEPELLSFSFWDAGGATWLPTHQQPLASLVSSLAPPAPPMSPGQFAGFGAAQAAAAAAPTSASLQNLAVAAADRLVYCQQQQSQQQQLALLQALTMARQQSASGGGGSSGGDSLAVHQRLLHAWVSAASAAAALEVGQGGAAAAELQRLVDMFAADGSGSSRQPLGLSSATLQCMALDMCSALAPGDVAQLVQLLQTQLQTQQHQQLQQQRMLN